MATRTKIIDGEAFEVTAPYEAGHTLTEIEAKVLNQVRSENIGNNLRQQIKDAKEAGKTIDELRALVAAYDSEYVFTTPGAGGGSRSLDPVEREARAIARDYIKGKLAETGCKLTKAPEGYTDEEWKAKVEENVEKVASNEKVLAEAKKRVAAKKKVLEGELEDLGI